MIFQGDLRYYARKHAGPSFQRFAVRTSRKLEDISSVAAKKKQELAEHVKDLSKNMESFKNQQ